MSTISLPNPVRRRGATAAGVAFSFLVALGFFSLQAELPALDGRSGILLALDIVVGVLGTAALPLVRRAPVGLALVLSALLTVSAALTPAAGTAVLWVAQRRRLPVAIGVALAGVAGHTVRELWRPVPDRPLVLWIAIIVASYAALVGWGAQNQARRALVDSLRDRARRAEADQANRLAEARRGERTKIAREMHDVLAHRLSLLAAYAGALEFRPDAPPEELARASGVIRTGAHQALEELREVIGVLREDRAETEGDRPQPTFADVPRLLEESRAAGTPVRLDNRIEDPGTVPDVLGRTVYRVVQEALTNARKHAAGQSATVLLAGKPGRHLLVVVTNPTADPAGDRVPGSGTGLVGLRERVQLAGGRLDAKAGRGRFRIWAVLPWPA
ncbi:MAG TPA: histidine kinase [Mycobacteriales bacterium]|jgi:signal transduction histidine kinase|nr:histidine kinase [Mycobacteriales bacterium]